MFKLSFIQLKPNKVHDKANEWFSSLPEEMSAALVRHFGPMPSRTDDHAEFEVSI